MALVTTRLLRLFFGDNRNGKETTLRLDAPLTKTFGRAFGFNLGATADITTFKNGKGKTIKNNIYYITPAVLLKSPNFILNAGLTPTWSNQIFSMLPNFTACNTNFSFRSFLQQQ